MSNFIPNEKGEAHWFMSNAWEELSLARVHVRNHPELVERINKVLSEIQSIKNATPKRAT